MKLFSRIYSNNQYCSIIQYTEYITSKIERQLLTIFNAAVFGRIVYGRSIFGYGVQYGSNLINSQIGEIMQITSNVELDLIKIDSDISNLCYLNSNYIIKINLTSVLQEES